MDTALLERAEAGSFMPGLDPVIGAGQVSSFAGNAPESLRPSGSDRDMSMSVGFVAGPAPSPDEVLRILIEDHGPAMFRLARSIMGDGALAEDVVQESLLKAWQAAGTLHDDSALRAWALRITHNTAISALRKRREDLRPPETMPELSTGPTVDRQVDGRLMVDELLLALDTLDPLTRSIVILREVEDMTYEDIASALDVALPTVKTRLFRARKQLAHGLEGWRV
jgi:RNA polymerase sigma-70 factor, ECF subfamily